MDITQIDPDCRAGKHTICYGKAWDDALDELGACLCDCHQDPTEASQATEQVRVTVYTPDTSCTACTNTFRKLDKEGIAYQTIVVPEAHKILRDELKDRAEQLGVAGGFPCVDVYDPNTEDTDVWFGFRPDKIEALKAKVQA